MEEKIGALEEKIRRVNEDLGALALTMTKPFGYIGRQQGRATLNLSAVQVASDYLAVLLAGQEVENAEQNYRGLITSTRRARRLVTHG